MSKIKTTESGCHESAILERAAERIRILGHPTRLLIVCTLKNGERPVGELADVLDISIGQVSQHLQTLAKADLINGRKDGRQVFYSVKAPWVHDVLGALCRQFDREIDEMDSMRPAFEALRARLNT